MKPTLEELRKGSTTWIFEHLGVHYSLNHHGISDHSPEGIWCFYIHINEEMFINDTDFALFDREPEIYETAIRKRETYRYDDVSDYGFHGGITFYERTDYLNRSGVRMKALKIGCDYAHSWDRDSGYWQGLGDVKADAIRLIEKLAEAHPVKWRCNYCGKIDNPDQFYIAQNGSRVHKSQQEHLEKEGWDKWMPKEEQAA